MMVCAHGNVTEFCKERDMVICDRWEGELSEYRGPCCVLVTDKEMSEHEYYFEKGNLLAKGIELVSTRHSDDKLLSEYLVYSNARRSTKRKPTAEAAVIEKMRALRAAGRSLREIQRNVRRSDGSEYSVSTIKKYTEMEKKDGD